MQSTLPPATMTLGDRFLSLYNSMDKRQGQELVIEIAEIFLRLYEQKHPEKKVFAKAIESAKEYLAGRMGIGSLLQIESDAWASAYMDEDSYWVTQGSYAATYAAHSGYSIYMGSLIVYIIESQTSGSVRQELVDLLKKYTTV